MPSRELCFSHRHRCHHSILDSPIGLLSPTWVNSSLVLSRARNSCGHFVRRLSVSSLEDMGKKVDLRRKTARIPRVDQVRSTGGPLRKIEPKPLYDSMYGIYVYMPPHGTQVNHPQLISKYGSPRQVVSGIGCSFIGCYGWASLGLFPPIERHLSNNGAKQRRSNGGSGKPICHLRTVQASVCDRHRLLSQEFRICVGCRVLQN